jgi:hypothetical protein
MIFVHDFLNCLSTLKYIIFHHGMIASKRVTQKFMHFVPLTDNCVNFVYTSQR